VSSFDYSINCNRLRLTITPCLVSITLKWLVTWRHKTKQVSLHYCSFQYATQIIQAIDLWVVSLCLQMETIEPILSTAVGDTPSNFSPTQLNAFVRMLCNWGATPHQRWPWDGHGSGVASGRILRFFPNQKSKFVKNRSHFIFSAAARVCVV